MLNLFFSVNPYISYSCDTLLFKGWQNMCSTMNWLTTNVKWNFILHAIFMSHSIFLQSTLVQMHSTAKYTIFQQFSRLPSPTNKPFAPSRNNFLLPLRSYPTCLALAKLDFYNFFCIFFTFVNTYFYKVKQIHWIIKFDQLQLQSKILIEQHPVINSNIDKVTTRQFLHKE